MANKPKKLTTEEITLILITTFIISVAVIFSITIFFQSSTTSIVKKMIILVVSWFLVFFSAITIKASVLSGDREPNNKDWADVALSSFISVIVIVGSTLLVAEPTIIGRAFENTVGYQLLKKEDLAIALKKIFKQEDGTEIPESLEIGLIITQMFSSDDKQTFNNYITDFNDNKQFHNIIYKGAEEDKNNLYDTFVVKKYNTSMAILASLATIASIITCYNPIKYPWINV